MPVTTLPVTTLPVTTLPVTSALAGLLPHAGAMVLLGEIVGWETDLARAADFVDAMQGEIGATEGWARFNLMLAVGIVREAAALTTHQLRLERRHRGAVRRSTAQLLRRIVVEPGRQPA